MSRDSEARPVRGGAGRLWAIAAGAALAAATVLLRPAGDREIRQSIPRQATAEKGFLSSNACRSCHPAQYASWHDSYHRTMTQMASPESIVAPFEDIRLPSGGVTFELQRQGGEYWVAAEPGPGGLAGPAAERHRIVMTTGSHHLQGYWVNSQGRELRLLPWMFHIATGRWMPFQDTFLVDPSVHFVVDPHFQRGLRWNDTCIACHSVDGRPKLDVSRGTLNSEVAELGIACEACHGPSDSHVHRHRNPLVRYPSRWDGQDDSTIVNPAKLPHDRSSQVCGQCHSTFERDPPPSDYWVDGPQYRAGDELPASRPLVLFADQQDQNHPFHGSYWNDGTMRIGGREYLGLIESPCYQQGDMSCLSCHSMHDSDPNDQLAARMDGDQACLQCHADLSDDLQAHTHHKPESSGSRCYNCHMPHTSYALFKAIRSHRVVTPQTSGLRSDRPNSCNLCHVDRTLQWTADHLSDWYGMPSVELDPPQQAVSAALLWLLRGDAAQRVVTAWNMGQPAAHQASGDSWQAPFLAQLLEDPYSAVRFVAYQSLRKHPGFEQFEYDFIGPAESRARARQMAVLRWARTRQAAPHAEGILMTEDGSLQSERIRELLEQRDDRPITLPE